VPTRATPFVTIGILATLVFCGISLVPAGERWPSTATRFLFLVPIDWGVFLLRRFLLLRPAHFALFARGARAARPRRVRVVPAPRVLGG
jgi:hypothetical protein